MLEDLRWEPVTVFKADIIAVLIEDDWVPWSEVLEATFTGYMGA